jgi:azurin
MRPATFVLSVAVLVAAAACNNKEDNRPSPTPTPAASAAPATAAPSPAPVATEAPKPAVKVELQIESVANTMTFSKAGLSAPAGSEVHLTFKNNSTMTTLPHNWVLVKPGTEANVAAAGLKMGEPAGYIDVRSFDVIAHTPMAKPGETTEVTFTAPAAGTYPFICTVPGHYMLMKGVFTAAPQGAPSM